MHPRLKGAQGLRQGPSEQKIQHAGLKSDAGEYPAAQFGVVADDVGQFTLMPLGAFAVCRCEQLSNPPVIAPPLVFLHCRPHSLHARK